MVTKLDYDCLMLWSKYECTLYSENRLSVTRFSSKKYDIYAIATFKEKRHNEVMQLIQVQSTSNKDHVRFPKALFKISVLITFFF